MISPTQNFVTCSDSGGSHRMAYWQWGNPQGRHVVLCVHGLTRQGRDFDTLARALCDHGGPDLRVVCPDVAGRGQSDWLTNPSGYVIPTYVGDMLVLLSQLHALTLDWVGTSMGGVIGMAIAGQPGLPPHARVRRLVLNDVGPVLEWQALQRIGQHLGKISIFTSEQQAADAMQAYSKSFGPHTPAQWLALSRPMLRPLPDGSGRLTLHYDPAIALPFMSVSPLSSAQGEALLWHAYDHITADTLLLRGALSDLLSPATAHAMTLRGPRASLIEFADVGHAPTLVADDQVRALVSFLLD